MSDTPALEPWERQPRETAKQYAAFCTYRDLGPMKRSAQAVSNVLTHSFDMCHRWSVAKQWRVRAEKWDAYIELEGRRQGQEAHRQRIAKFNEQMNVAAAEGLSGVVHLAALIAKCLREVKSGDIPPALLPSYIQAASRFIEAMTNANAVALGLPALLKALGDDA